MQIHVGEQWRNHCPLRRPYLGLRPLAIFRYSRLQPFLDQAKHPAIGHAVLDELHRPFVAHVVKEPANVRIEHPVHSLPVETHAQRIQRLVWAAPGPEPIRKALEVHLVNLVEDGHYGLLNNLVLQRRNAQRTLPPVWLRYVDSPRGLCPIRSPLYPAVQIDQSILQPGFILLPCHAIYSRCSLPLQCEKAVPQQINRYMVEQSGEPFLPPSLCCFSHTAQSLGHSFPALCRARVGPNDVLLGPRPSLPNLRRRLPFFVRLVHWYCGAVRLLHSVHVRRSAWRLLGPASILTGLRRSGGLPA